MHGTWGWPGGLQVLPEFPDPEQGRSPSLGLQQASPHASRIHATAHPSSGSGVRSCACVAWAVGPGSGDWGQGWVWEQEEGSEVTFQLCGCMLLVGTWLPGNSLKSGCWPLGLLPPSVVEGTQPGNPLWASKALESSLEEVKAEPPGWGDGVEVGALGFISALTSLPSEFSKPYKLG